MRIMKYFTQLLLLTFFTSLNCFSQTSETNTIKGRIISKQTNEAVANATILAKHQANEQAIIAYSLSDETGVFQLSLPVSAGDSIYLIVQGLSISSWKSNVKVPQTGLQIFVEQKSIDLKEVVVTNKNIDTRGDTIIYNAVAFQNQTDKVLEDIMKKMPGISINSSGQIMYLNKPVSQLQVEGIDLTLGKQGLITKNLKADMISSVEVVQDFKPFTVMKGMSMPDATMINIRLKKSALGAFFSTLELYAGLPIGLLGATLSGMRFTTTQQDLILYKGDNTGKNITSELTSFYNPTPTKFPSFSNLITPNTPPISENHYRNNKSHMGSFSSQSPLGKNFTLNTNIHNIYDKQITEGDYLSELFLANNLNPILINESLKNTNTSNLIEGKVKVAANTSKYVFNNQTTAQFEKGKELSEIIQSDYTQNERSNDSKFHVSNSLSYEWVANEFLAHGITGNIMYNELHNNLYLNPPIKFIFYNNAYLGDEQKVEFQNFSAAIKYIIALRFGKNSSFSTAFGLSTDINKLNSHIYGKGITLDNKSLSNRLRYNVNSISIEPNIKLSITSKIRPVLSIKTSFLRIDRSDISFARRFNTQLFEPRFSMKLPLSTRLDLTLNSSINTEVGNIMQEYAGVIIGNYRNVSRNNPTLSKSHNWINQLSLNLKYPENGIFANLSSYASSRKNSHVMNRFYSGIVSENELVSMPNTTNLFSVSMVSDFSIPKLFSSLSVTLGYSYYDALGMQERASFGIKNQRISGALSLSTHIRSYFYASAKIGLSSNTNGWGETSHNKYLEVNPSFNLDFFLSKNLTLSTSAKHYYNSLMKKEESPLWLLDARLKYKINRINIALDWSNILNINAYTTYQNTPQGQFFSVYTLRPTELLLTIGFELL